MEIDLSVNLAGLTLEHPIMNGAGSCKTLEEVELLARSSLSAITVGSGTVKKEEGNTGDTFYYEPGLGSINSIGLKNPGKEYYQDNLPKMIEVAHTAGKKLVFSGVGESADDLAELAMLAQATGVDLFEANFACPNRWRGEVGVPERMICYDLSAMDASLRTVRRYYSGKLSAKVGPYSDWVTLENFAHLVRDYADLVTVCNTFPRAFMFAPGTKRPAVVPQFKGLGGYAGEGMRPIALGQVIQWRNALDKFGSAIPIIGSGGTSSGRHVQEFLWSGASAVQIATVLLKKGKLDPAPADSILSDFVDIQMENPKAGGPA